MTPATTAEGLGGGGAAMRRGRVRWPRRAVVAVGVAALSTGAGAVLRAASAATPTVAVGTNATFGSILTTGAGMALYTLDSDADGQSTCHGSCATVWPPLDVAVGATPTVGAGVTGTVSTSTQADGTVQVTYDGSPLYTFVGDGAPDQVTGNDVRGFFVVKVAAPVTTTTAPVTPSTGSGSSGTAPTGSASSGPSSPSAANGAPGAGTSVGSASLAFTGAGPGMGGLALLGLALTPVGALLALRPRRRPGGARPDGAPWG